MARTSGRHSSGKLVLWIAVFAALAAGVAGYKSAPQPKGVLAGLDCDYAAIDLKSGYRVRPALAKTDKQETFAQLVSRLKPYAAITGTYYGPDKKPIGDIVTDGKIVCRGCQRQGIGFTSGGRIVFLERRGSSRIDWRGCDAGVACGPRLLRNGKIDINVQRDGFRPVAAKLEARRCAAGATKDGKLVLLVVRESVTLKKLAEAMLALRAVDAINLDGGALCGFYVDGRLRAQPILPVSNVIAVYRK